MATTCSCSILVDPRSLKHMVFSLLPVQLTFVDFLEALARLAAVMPLPTDEEMKKFNVRQHVRGC